jgi:hypothetical protein
MIMSRIAQRSPLSLILLGVFLQGACKEAKITETPVAVSSIDVSQTAVSLQVGQSTQVTGTPKSSSGESLTARGVTWSSGNNAIASVSATGVILGVSAGSTTADARSGGIVRSVPVTVTAPPSINLSASAASFTAPPSGNPAAQIINVTNGGGGSLVGLISSIQYDVGQAPGWLSAVLSSTTAPSNLTLQASVAGLSPANYGATVTISSTVATVRTVRVTLAIPAIAVAPPTIAFVGDVGGAIPAAQTVSVTNAGGGSVTGLAIGTIAYTGGQTGWLTATLSGSTPTATLTLRPNAILPQGTYTATVPVTAANAVNSPQNVTVSYTVRLPVPVIANLTVSQGLVNGGGNCGTIYTYTFTYTDANGDVPLNPLRIILRFIGRPSGFTQTLAWTGTAAGGNGSSGTVSTTVCWRYDLDQSIDVFWSLLDTVGGQSNELTVTHNRPPGALDTVNVNNLRRGASAVRPGGN